MSFNNAPGLQYQLTPNALKGVSRIFYMHNSEVEHNFKLGPSRFVNQLLSQRTHEVKEMMGAGVVKAKGRFKIWMDTALQRPKYDM